VPVSGDYKFKVNKVPVIKVIFMLVRSIALLLT